MKHKSIALAILGVIILSSLLSSPTRAYPEPSEAQLSLRLDPAAVVIKVGDTATINATLSSFENSSIAQACFDIEGFPSTGFVTTISPQCTSLLPYQKLVASLNVTATPAAAPQNVTALIVARSGSFVAQAFLLVTVVPAISPIIPWTMIAVFVGILTVTLFYGNRRKRTRRRRTK